MIHVSIVIPTLREENSIGKLLQALIQQDYHGPVEIIVVDGNSTGRTQEIVQQFPEVRLLVREQPGTSAQRNLGASVATGDLLIFMDADNNPSINFLSRIANAYEKRPFVVACPWFIADSSRPVIRFIYCAFNCLFWLSQWRFHTGSGVCIIIQRDIFQRINGFAEWLHLGEDIHLIRRAAEYGPHRHLPVPLRTSARRFEKFRVWHMVRFYARISPLLLAGNFKALQHVPYPSAPYDKTLESTEAG